ncbi:MAG: Flavohemoprotein [Bacteroidetes bacterium ADurb.Bin397]|jgi:hemoglobin-like flavoprotein|nr:MAG: Flavohemoprotein [Bacteroidetes bacterium ADurb.Bin397]
MLTAKQIELVQNTWSTITPVSQQMGESFYSRLFQNHPELKPMFKSDPKDQAMKLMFMISYLVHRLGSFDDLKDEIIKLASRHTGYGTKKEHYGAVGDALLATLKESLGKSWTPETEAAWTDTYMLIAGLMQQAHSSK